MKFNSSRFIENAKLIFLSFIGIVIHFAFVFSKYFLFLCTSTCRILVIVLSIHDCLSPFLRRKILLSVKFILGVEFVITFLFRN